MEEREIKFRAFGTDGVMHYDWFTTSKHKSETRGIEVVTGSMAMVTAVSVMQYTGLKDRTGKEIYEGDIVRYSRTEERGKYKELGNLIHDGPISWDEQRCCFSFYYKFPSGGAYSSIGLEFKDERFVNVTIEVIGNVHEHPHILRS